MQLSEAGLQFIAEVTGCKLKSYRRTTDNRLVIGYDHPIGLNHPSKITQELALDYLVRDLKPAVARANRYLIRPIAQHQFDAVVSYAASTTLLIFSRSALIRHLENDDLEKAARSFLSRRDLYFERRKAEEELFRGLRTPGVDPIPDKP